jgi:hypothetical protein
MVRPVARGAIYIRRSIGEDTFDMGPGAKIWMAAANGSTVGTEDTTSVSVGVTSGRGAEGVSVGDGIGSGMSVGGVVGTKVLVEGIIVAEGDAWKTGSGEGEPCSTIHGGGGTSVGVVPQPATAAHAINTVKKKRMRPIYFSARRSGLRAVCV